MKDIFKNIYLNCRKLFLHGICQLLFFKRFANKKNTGQIKTILFIRIDRIGDLVLSTPTIKALKQNYPTSKLVVLASKSNHAILNNNPYVDDTVIYNDNKGYLHKINMIRRLRNYNFDLAIDPYADYELKTAFYSLVSGAKESIGFSGYGREFLFSHSVSNTNRNRHFIDMTLDILEPLSVMKRERLPHIYISEKELYWAKSWIKQKLDANKLIIGLHPGAYYASQRWPAEYFAELINRLKEDNEFEIIIFGGLQDEQLVKHIVSMASRRTVNFISNNIREFVILLSHCNILVCNNSGPLHVAVALNIPTISFMGPTVKERWIPLENIHKVLRIDDLPCIGCNSGLCKIKTHDCMHLISPVIVAKNIKEAMIRNGFKIPDQVQGQGVRPIGKAQHTLGM